MTYRSEPFDPDRHDVERFRCGEASLDDWLREQARPAAVRRTARTWVWTGAQDTVVGYYGFTRLPDTLRLVQKLADVEAALGP